MRTRLAAVAKLSSIEDLNLQLTGVTDDGIRRLAPLRSLRNLTFWKTRVTGAGFKDLSCMQKLEKLDLHEATRWIQCSRWPAHRRRSGKKSKKKRGGQRGHRKHERTLIPAEQCSKVVPLHPENCRRCGTRLKGEDSQPLRHQVWELPEIQPILIEYQRHRRTCSCCGETTCAPLPAVECRERLGGLLNYYHRRAA